LPATQRKRNALGIELRNVSGGNTEFSFSNGATTLNTFIQLIRFTSLFKKGDSPVQVEGLTMAGNRFNFSKAPLQIKSNSYILSGNTVSYLTGTEIKQVKGTASLAALLVLLIPVSYFMAFRGIRADQKLVKSLDKLR